MLINPDFVKYPGIHIDNRLYWNYHVKHVIQKCCQRIGILKKVLSCLPKYVAILYYNVFIRSCFSYCAMFWFRNDRSGECKLLEKIEHVINLLVYNNKQSVHDFIVSSQICDL